MRVKILFLVCMMIVPFGDAMSVDWEKLGFSVVSSGERGGENFVQLRDSRKRLVKVRYFGELEKKWGKIISRLDARLGNMKFLKVDKMDFFQNKNSLEILVIPKKFTYKGINFLPHLPGGLVFIYDRDLSYNFRFNKDNYFIRIKDKFYGEQFLCDNLKEVHEDPIAYLKKREPKFFLKKLNELEKKINSLIKSHENLQNAVLYYENTGFLGFGNTKIDRVLIRNVIEIRKEKPEMDAEEILKALDKKKIKASEKEIELILNVFYGDFTK